MKYPIMFAIDNRGVCGLEHCFGAPFVAKDWEQAKEMVVCSIEKEKDLLDLKNFYLVELLPYDITRDFPLVFEESALCEEICVADLFEDEESEVADEQE